MFSFEEKKLENLVFVDIETTGSSLDDDRITEIGVLVYRSGKCVEKFNTLLNPQRPIHPYISQITGITDRMLLEAPVFSEISEKLYELLKDSTFIAHNVGFDYSFVAKEFERAGLSYVSDQLCTVRLSRTLYPQHRKHNLDEIVRRMDIKCERRHRAFDDAEAIFKFYQKAQKEISSDKFYAALQAHLKVLNKTPNN